MRLCTSIFFSAFSMKKYKLKSFLFASALLTGVLISPSCNKGTTNSTQRTVDFICPNMPFEIPVLPANGEYDSIISFEFELNMDSFVKSFDGIYDTASIQKVSLKYCTLTLSDGTTTDNFRNFHTVNVGITSGTNPYITRFTNFNNIVDTAAYTLDVPRLYDPNLASYFKADSLHYRVYGNLRRSTTQTLKGTANIAFDMTLKD